jgi:hypothetical protein
MFGSDQFEAPLATPVMLQVGSPEGAEALTPLHVVFNRGAYK